MRITFETQETITRYHEYYLDLTDEMLTKLKKELDEDPELRNVDYFIEHLLLEYDCGIIAESDSEWEDVKPYEDIRNIKQLQQTITELLKSKI